MREEWKKKLTNSNSDFSFIKISLEFSKNKYLVKEFTHARKFG